MEFTAKQYEILMSGLTCYYFSKYHAKGVTEEEICDLLRELFFEKVKKYPETLDK